MNIFRKEIIKKGFTLIELLVVVFIIAVLTTVVLVSLGRARLKSRDDNRKKDLAVIQQALEVYYSDKHQFPDCPNPAPNTKIWCLVSDLNGTSSSTDIKKYLVPIPKDPKPSTPDYYYGVINNDINNSSHYILLSFLENTDDSEDFNKIIEGYWQGQPGNNYGGNQSYHYYVSSD